jgi:hypothetical protein
VVNEGVMASQSLMATAITPSSPTLLSSPSATAKGAVTLPLPPQRIALAADVQRYHKLYEQLCIDTVQLTFSIITPSTTPVPSSPTPSLSSPSYVPSLPATISCMASYQ